MSEVKEIALKLLKDVYLKNLIYQEDS